MFNKAKILDDLMRETFELLLKSRSKIKATKGETHEISGILLQLDNPNARISRTEIKGTIFSCLGELLWYLSGTNDLGFIEYYLSIYRKFSDDGETLNGAYGPRVFGSDRKGQFFSVLNLLSKKPTTRQAVIQVFGFGDLVGNSLDIPCTCTLQFLIRDERLHLSVTMRSNDAYKGLPHDIFAFTMFQEIMARSLGLPVGQYKHYVGSLHLYTTDFESVHKYIAEDWQSNVPMPRMPEGNPWTSIEKLLEIEKAIRLGVPFDDKVLDELDNYWADFARILIIFRLTKTAGSIMVARKYIKNMSSDVYLTYLKKKVDKLEQKGDTQSDLFV
ncbi:MAG: thymidylate synthase [Methylotenera sp.]|uniref:thymidylate synthase n=1 Tax=Methylotenera sp. TaxID=2051956 RepID=UPI002488DA57|nr:thymidylate synthase [Methylotenera sp.]MDI1309727.1 thymidylate synthase [Methylotenera sp.]